MDSQVLAALISSGVALVTSVITLVVFLVKQKNERAKLTIERERMHAEVAKLDEETAALRDDRDDVRRQAKRLEEMHFELQQQREIAIFNREFSIYPELLELVYRLRNSIRDYRTSLAKELADPSGYVEPPVFDLFALNALTENLYKYRAFIDESTFRKLHQLKLIGQGVVVLDNRMTRNPLQKADSVEMDLAILRDHFSTLITQMSEMLQTLDSTICPQTEQLYNDITRLVKKTVASHV